MAIPHNTLKDKESNKISDQVAAYLAAGGTIKTETDSIEGEYLRMYNYLDKSLTKGRSITKTSICKGLRITPTQCTEIQRVLNDRRLIAMNAIGTVTAVL